MILRFSILEPILGQFIPHHKIDDNYGKIYCSIKFRARKESNVTCGLLGFSLYIETFNKYTLSKNSRKGKSCQKATTNFIVICVLVRIFGEKEHLKRTSNYH